MPFSHAHALLAGMSIDCEQLVHQRGDARRCVILRIELDRFDVLSSRVRKTSGMDHLRPTHTIVGGITIGLQYPFELAQELLWSFALPSHAEVEHNA
jgi:hypothetical protein